MARAARLGKFALGSVAAGGGVGALMYYQRLSQNKALSAPDWNAAQDQQRIQEALSWVRQCTVSRRSDVARHSSSVRKPPVEDAGRGGPVIELFRYTTCPYCSKVKAFLDYYDVPHDLVEVEPMFKSQISESRYKKLPQIRFGGEGGTYLVDSDLIVETLAELVGAGAQLQDDEVQRWRAWCRESLVRHVTLNINLSLMDAWRGYAYIDAFDTIPFANKLFLKVMGAPIMYLVAKYKTRPTLIKAGELSDGEDPRSVFHRQVDRYVKESNLSERKPFHGGSKPDLADLDVYGTLQSVRGHKVYDDLLSSTSIASWLARMDKETGKAAYLPSSSSAQIEMHMSS